MNWYKGSQKITEVERYSPVSGPSYLDIGHDTFTERSPHKIWIWKDGKLLIEEDTYKNPVVHADLDEEYESYYRGRYDVDTNDISIVKPYSYGFKRLPTELIRALTREFGDDLKMYVY